MTSDQQREALVAAASDAASRAYAPYSNFCVGAAVLDGDGVIHTGANVENASYGLTICAERVAIAAAVSKGITIFTAVAIATHFPRPCPPCGMCLQTLVEFSDDMDVYLVADGQVEQSKLSELLPRTFDKDYLKR
jgi:cytidine deaminase